MQTEPTIFQSVSNLAGRRTHLSVKELAVALNKQPQTIRAELSRKGSAYGIRPVRIGRSPMFPVTACVALLEGRQGGNAPAGAQDAALAAQAAKRSALAGESEAKHDAP